MIRSYLVKILEKTSGGVGVGMESHHDPCITREPLRTHQSTTYCKKRRRGIQLDKVDVHLWDAAIFAVMFNVWSGPKLFRVNRLHPSVLTGDFSRS